jgi:hypothetical protein
MEKIHQNDGDYANCLSFINYEDGSRRHEAFVDPYLGFNPNLQFLPFYTFTGSSE